MPKGGPLSFLNKKTWHPGNSQNQERLWKKEQEHAQEQKRLEEFKKQIAEERQKKELEDIAVNAGVKVQQDRLDWMYQGSMMAKAEAQQRQEEAMLEGRPVQLDADGGPSKAETVALLPSFYSEDTPASANETWARLHSDPLFAIKQQEIAARKRIIQNPVQMDVIKERVKLSKEAKKEAKAAAKVAKKEAKKAAKNMEAEMTAARRGVALDRHQSNGVDAPYGHQHHANAWDDRPWHMDTHPSGYGNDQNGRDTRKRSITPGRARHDGGGGARKQQDPAGPVIPDGYGLKFGSNVPAGLESQDRRDKARETKERLEKAAKVKAEEDAAAARMRHVKTEYKTGRLTEEERLKKLAEMTGNASVHEEARWHRLASARKKDDAEEASLAQHRQGDKPEDRHASDTAKFMQRTGKKLAEGVDSLEDRVGRAKFYQDRGSSDRGAFRR
ncbi:hypothetical protein WJX74_000705 [Apatococcus lobatus]|uniref:CBF1-interacting co-repressor CIR N-terminal domain-containing protein n=2 Tax=Apatococcus TaxID=904362 RepID=A0AAW1T549_9CHLO